jgi:hypothetical protein
MRNAYNISLGRPKKERPRERYRRRKKCDIKMKLKGTGYKCMYWNCLTELRVLFSSNSPMNKMAVAPRSMVDAEV